MFNLSILTLLQITLTMPSDPFLKADLEAKLGASATGVGTTVGGFNRGPAIVHIVLNIIDFLAFSLTTLSVLSLVVGAILYITSFGKDPMIEHAKNMIKWGIWGMIMGLMSFGIVQVIIFGINKLG